ncbi:MAG: N-acetylmuramoyl-L-alanine amidase, partial [Desulfobacterales bacterium]|nr:N-acetylmuramoyl-L-alanine amidase [Desulfobacterales bacterium]
GVKQAPFYVLIGAHMPAILVQTGFLSNPMEKKRLFSKKYQECLAEGICAGIVAYIKNTGGA